ncbi:hypothetical protein COY32_03335 [candidate division WWE3 bacterium CG_4_10_14_0_2_um_filter_41_14]|uniref:DDH domain-containing protein n=1 Tax=candidate division WWE3 bacterium CG_4_10_14_0_2_um_filter_41_14 TaxID=1975072 RepID=A0A2M7TJT0_UNCKA|nr:MAG: hypothetical protein COY32_03335 [candidate division WWE3 bacterium CG_4_10_14_0_2_um_filter_41_14]
MSTLAQSITETSSHIKSAIDSSQNILLCLHPHADGDSVGSTFALFHLLTNMGKHPVVIAGDNDQLPEYLLFLPGVSNLVNKSFSQISITDFDLFISCDASSPQMISTNSPPTFPLSIPTIIIDHHETNTLYGQINCVEKELGSTCEILAKLFSDWNVSITNEIATCLFTGIWTDTGGLIYDRVSKDTYQIIGNLLPAGFDVSRVVSQLNKTISVELELFGKLLSLLKRAEGGKITVLSIDFQTFVNQGYEEQVIDGAYAKVKQMVSTAEDAYVTVFIRRNVDQTINVSVRNNNLDHTYDISVIAKHFGGGGHKRAAGFTPNSNETLESVEKRVVSKIIETYSTLLTD